MTNLLVPVMWRAASAFALAFLVETMVEFLFGSPIDRFPKLKPFKWMLMYVAAGGGVFLAFFYRLDLIGLIPAVIADDAALIQVTWVGMTLTGLTIGRGANFVHDFFMTFVRNVFQGKA